MQKAIIVDIEQNNASLEELKGLAKACLIDVVHIISQKKDKPDPLRYVGKGKLEEIKAYLNQHHIECLLFDIELTPNQFRFLEDYFDCLILDRTLLILELFKKRAKTKEAILQVKIAELKHLLPRLVGMKASMLHQQGGKGFRGPGEKQLELDQRALAIQIIRLESQLDQLKKNRMMQRRKRQKSRYPSVCLVGYTNVGKSSLMNVLIENHQKQVSVKDQLFETLETATRLVEWPQTPPFFLTDTIGFVDRLPHHLIEAFHATLEEIAEADLLIIVLDHSSPNNQKELTIIKEVLKQLNGSNKQLLVLSKSDCKERYGMINHAYLPISSKTGYNIDTLIKQITSSLFEFDQVRIYLIPFTHVKDYWYIKKNYHISIDQELHNGFMIEVALVKSDVSYFSQFQLST